MTRTLPRLSFPLFLAFAAVVAVVAFGATRWITDMRSGDQLPPLELSADTAAGRPGALDAAALFRTRAPATVMIEAPVGERESTGAGVVVSTDGTIVTASHVVHDYETGQDAESIMVSFTSDGLTPTDVVPARLIARDRFNDLAVLQVDPSRLSRKLVAARVSDSELTVGSDVAAIGYPTGGGTWTQTTGSVSSVHRAVPSRINDAWSIPDAVQFDAAINPGNSGGPLFNARGDVVGIVQQIASPTKSNTGISFAISAQIVQRALRLAATNADIPYAFSGLRTRTASPQYAQAVGVEVSGGAVVQESTGPAAKAGLRAGSETIAVDGTAMHKGDVIVAIAGQQVTSSTQLERALGLVDPGSTVELDVVRGGERVTLQLQPDQRR